MQIFSIFSEKNVLSSYSTVTVAPKYIEGTTRNVQHKKLYKTCYLDFFISVIIKNGGAEYVNFA